MSSSRVIEAFVHGLGEVCRALLRKQAWNLLDLFVKAGTLFHQGEHVIDGRAQKSQIREIESFDGDSPPYFDIHEAVLGQVVCYLVREE